MAKNAQKNAAYQQLESRDEFGLEGQKEEQLCEMVWDVRNIGAQKLRRSKSMDGFANNL